MGKARPSLSEYARHVVDGMLAGAPYILSPGGDGVLSTGAPSGRGGGVLVGVFGYGRLTPAAMVMQTVAMPLLALVDTGEPPPVSTSLFHRVPSADSPLLALLERRLSS